MIEIKNPIQSELGFYTKFIFLFSLLRCHLGEL